MADALRIAVEAALCTCEHRGVLGLRHSQDWVTVDAVPVLVKGDFVGRPVAACMGSAALVGVLPCLLVRSADDAASHSAFVTVDGQGVALSTAEGSTDWSQVGAKWTMRRPAQDWIEIAE